MARKAEEKVEPGAEKPHRPLRADAQRNLATLLDAAMAVFTESGVDAPIRQIADRAGVGVGTVYRHFPERADLIEAVFRNEVDACADAATTLAAQYGPDEALQRWIERFTAFLVAKRGLGKALHSGNPSYGALPAYFDTRFQPALTDLLHAAAAAGHIRPDADANDLLWAIASLCASRRGRDPAQIRRVIDLLLDGLRVSPKAPA